MIATKRRSKSLIVILFNTLFYLFIYSFIHSFIYLFIYLRKQTSLNKLKDGMTLWLRDGVVLLTLYFLSIVP